MKNKYQEALDVMCRRCNNHDFCDATGCTPKKDLQELVDKATPIKVEKSKGYRGIEYTCPICGNYLGNNFDIKYDYCICCGQKFNLLNESDE